MPNLVGLHDPRASRGDLEQTIARMMDAVDLPSFHLQRRAAIAPSFACGNVLTGVEDNLDQPARGEGETWLMIDGELWNTAELQRELERAGHKIRGTGDAYLALAMYERRGLDFVHALNGQWNIALYDSGLSQVILASDRLGSRLLFYAADGPRFVFASEVKGVIAGRDRPTRAGGPGLLQLLSSHGHFGAATWLDGIELLDAGTIVRFDANGTIKKRYARLLFSEGPPHASEDDYAEGFARRLRVATERAMKDHHRLPIAITLSGGLDSRSLALSIDPKHFPIKSLTYGDPDSADVRYAAQLAEAIGLDHHYVEHERPKLEEESAKKLDQILGPSPFGRRGFYGCQIDRIAWRGEGMTNFAGLASPIWHPLYATVMRSVLNGAAGDALTGSHLTPQMLFQPPREKLIEWHRDGVYWQAPELVAKILNPTYYRNYLDTLIPAFDQTFHSIPGDDAMAIASVWDMENRQRRGAFASFVVERYFCTVRAPYLDHELAEFLASIPPLWRFQQRIYKKMLIQHHPKARHVPWAASDLPLTDNTLLDLFRQGSNFVIRRAKKLLPSKKDAPPAWAFRDVVKLIREDPDLGLAIDQWLASDHFPSDVFDARGVQWFMEEFRAGRLSSDATVLHNHLVVIAKAHAWWLGDRVKVMPPEADPASFGVKPTYL